MPSPNDRLGLYDEPPKRLPKWPFLLAGFVALVALLYVLPPALVITKEVPDPTPQIIPPNSVWTTTFIRLANNPIVLEVTGSLYREGSAPPTDGPFGPNGVPLLAMPKWYPMSRVNRLDDELPWLAVVGRVLVSSTPEPVYGPVFLVGERVVVDPNRVGQGQLELGINQIVRQNGHPVASFIRNQSGQFVYRVSQ